MSASTPFIAGNWKMHGLADSLREAQQVAEGAAKASARIAIFPPATLLSRMSHALAGSPVELGGQDLRAEASGAFTGDIAAEMLADAGARLALLGHSERRSGYGETDELIAAKTLAALRAGLEPVICVGETIDQRKGGKALDVVTWQVRRSLPAALGETSFAVAYEPVWAIGTGLTPTVEEIEEVHRAIRQTLCDQFGDVGQRTPILYGGSVKPANAAEILRAAEVGGALVGGASLKAADFLGIIEAL